MQELNQPIPAPSCSVGPEVLLGTSKNDVDLMELARSTLTVNLLQEMHRFSFDEETALVTLSQVAGCDLTLPKRFIKVPALFQCTYWKHAVALHKYGIPQANLHPVLA